eukprot:5460145-Amphidinium_carterae.1
MKQRHEQQMFQQEQFFQQALKKERDAHVSKLDALTHSQSGLGGIGVEMQTLHASQAIAHPCSGAPRAARACDGA